MAPSFHSRLGGAARTAPARRAPSRRAPSPVAPPPASAAPSASPAATLEEEVALLVSRTRRLLWNAAHRGLDTHGESIHLYRILAHLVRQGPSTQKDLADATMQHPAATSRLLDLLERRHLVRRKRDRRDRRNIQVAVTPGGRARFRVLAPAVRVEVTAALRPLSAGDRRRLATLLRRLATGVDSDARRPATDPPL